MPGAFVFCDPSFPPSTNYQAIFYDQTSGANAGTITGTKSSILGGDPSAPTNNINGDLVEAYNSVIAGGGGNSIFGIYSAITGGMGNTVHSVYSFIGGGSSNYVNLLSDCSAISSGFSNRVGITGGGGNGATFSFIGGGQNNFIDDTAAAVSHSGIFSGNGNTVADSCSSILGGAGNTIPAGFPNSHIIGSGIVLNPGFVGNPNSLHANNLWLDPATYFSSVGTPPLGTWPPGTVYVDTTGGNNFLRVV